jgi:hypothetical protein
MKSFKRGSALVASVAALIFSQTMGSLAAPVCPMPPPRVCPMPFPDDPLMIETFLKTNKIKTAADFVACLPAEYRDQNWIMMSLSQSLQSGTAEYPRIILTNKASTKVFGLELPTNPTAHAPNEIEYLQFVDDTNNKFGFYSIVTNEQKVIKNQNADGKDCRTCHFGNPRPNWDAYDSWGGMLPFNRDRVYESATVNSTSEDSVELKAIKRIFKSLCLKSDVLFMQLKLPTDITQDKTTGVVTIKFPVADIEPPFFYDSGTGELVPVEYKQDDNKHVVYPGDKETLVEQGGVYLRLNSSSKPAASDEGRGVALFDNFTIGFPVPVPPAPPPRPNPKRIAQSILDYTKDDPAVVDVRYVALAIANQALGQVGFEKCITADTLGKFAPKEDLDKLLAFQTTINPKVTDFPSLRDDTDTRRKSLPQLKANLESQNLEALIKANGDVFTPDRVNANIARRSTYGGPSQGVPFATDSILGWMIDRELYGNGNTPATATDPEGNQNTTIALFRLYLEPLPANDKGVSLPVNRWSMSVRTTAKLGPAEPANSRARNNTYTFGDLLSQYTTQLQSTLTGVLGNLSCSDLAAGSIKAFNAATNKE